MKTQFSGAEELYRLYEEDDRRSVSLSFEEKIRRLVELQRIWKGLYREAVCWTCFEEEGEATQKSTT